MAKTSIWQRVKSTVKSWFGGGKGSSGGGTKKKKEPPQPRLVTNNRDARNQTVSSRTGTGSTFNKRELVNSLKAQKKEEDRVKDAFKAKSTEYKSIAKSTSSASIGAKEKATPPTVRHRSTALGTMAEKDVTRRKAQQAAYQANRKEQTRAADKLKADIDKKYDASTKEGRRRIKSGEYASDPNVAKYEVLKHPIAASASRGALSGVSFGLSDLAAAKLTKGEAREAEKFYQANKSKGAELAGELAGSLAGFGLTGDVSKAAITRLAPKKVARLGEGATEFLAKNSLVRGAAEREAIRKLGATATKEEIERFARSKAAKIVAALGEDAAINLTTGGASDVLHAVAESDNPTEFLKNFGANAAMNLTLGTAVSAIPALRGSSVTPPPVRGAEPRLNAAERGIVEFPPRNESAIDVINPDLARRRKTVEIGAADEGIDVINPNLESRKPRPETEPKAEPPKREPMAEEVKAEPPKKKLTAEEKRELMLNRADEKADAIRAELGTESPAPVNERISKPKDVTKEYTVQLKRENGKKQKVKVEAKSEAEALDKAIGKKKGVKNASILESAEANPKVEPPTAKAQTETKNINLDDAVNKKREKKKFREQFHEFASSVKTKVSDSLNAFEEENKKFIRSDHQKWLENVGAIDKTRRSGAIASRSIGEAQVKWNGDVFEGGKSLKAIYDGMDEATEKDFDKYLLLKHAPDRIREGKPIFAGTQYDSVEACEKAAKELLDKHPEFAERAEELYQYTRNELQNRVDAGLIKQDVVDEWRKKYPNYVPTGRDGDFGGEHDIWDLAAQLKSNGNTIGAGEIKKAVGGDQPIRSIKEQLADATNRNWRDMSMNNLFRKMFDDKVADELATYADGGLEKVLDNTINLSKTKDGGKYFAEVFVDGDMKRVEVEKRFYDAIEDLYKNGRFGNGIDVMTDAASKVAHPFKNLVTSWNPIFMVKNGLRDFPEAVINSRQTKEFLQIMAQGDALRELKNDGEFLQAFRNSGVSQANFVNLEEALTKGDNWLKRGVNKFATLQEMVETYPRLIEYMATIKKMMPAGYRFKDGLKNVPPEIRDIAAANAADVTVNFGRSGSVGKMLNRGLVPFFNPSVQGWSKFLRNYSEQSGIKSTLELVLKAAAIGTGATAINNFLLEDNPNYQQISARDKATNYIIPVTWGKDVTADNTTLFIKIPKSRFAAAYSLPAVNIGNENKMGWAEMIKVGTDQVAPVDPSESHILAPLLDATKSKQGETWYGTPIVPQSLVGLPKSEQYDVNTSWFGKTLGKATSGLPEELQISPKKADYIIDAETGVIGDLLLPASTPSKQGSGNWAERHIAHPMGNVLKKSFTIDSTTQNNLSTRFYDQLDKASTKNQSSKAGEAESEEYKRLNSYSTEISSINKTIRALQGSKRKTKIEDVRGLQEFRNELMQDAINGNDTPNSAKTLNTVQKHAGTTYAINNFGSSADKKAMKLYGMAKYGDISKQDMRKAINDDKDFFKGVKSIGDLDAKMEKAGIKSNTTLSKAVALASSESNDELFGAYEATKKSRTESDNKMNRARAYFKDGGSENEYVKLETARKTMGKLTDFDEGAEIDKAEKQLAKGEISLAEYHEKEDSIKYNANLSYIGLATSLAQANAPERGYRLYDIKDKNIQKGINLAAMGFTARDYRKMAKELDTDGNGYPSSKEIREYVANSDVKDKATLYDALYYYKGKYNPFGTPTNYTRAQAAAMGNSNGIKSIGDDTKDFDLKAESGSGYSGYYRRGYGRRGYRRYGGGKSKAPAIKQSSYKAKKQSYKDIASSLKTRTSASTTRTASTVKVEPPKVKFKKYEV